MASGPLQTGLSPEQAAREATLRELGEAMVSMEAAARRIRRSIDTLASRRDADGAVLAALERCARELEASRRRLHHDGYLAEPQADRQAALFVPELDPKTEPLSFFPPDPAVE